MSNIPANHTHSCLPPFYGCLYWENEISQKKLANVPVVFVLADIICRQSFAYHQVSSALPIAISFPCPWDLMSAMTFSLLNIQQKVYGLSHNLD